MSEAVYGLIAMSFVVVSVCLILVSVCLILAFGPSWLAYWHGVGTPEQIQDFRWHACRRIVTHRHISVGGCRCRESSTPCPRGGG